MRKSDVTSAQHEVNLRRIRSYADVRFGDRKALRLPTPVVGVSRTKQSFAAECDINTIMRRYESTGILPGADRAVNARYMDVSGADFQQSMLVVASAKSAFAGLSARVRERFGNDPSELLKFVEDPENYEEARELGLLRADAVAGTPLAVPVVEATVGAPGETSGTSGVPGVIAKPVKRA